MSVVMQSTFGAHPACGSAARQTSLHPVGELEQLSLSTSYFQITIVKLFWKVISMEEFP